MTKKIDYRSISIELDDVLGKLQQPDIQVDEAVELYEQGLKLIKQCEEQLVHAENRIKQIKPQTKE